MNIMPAPSRNSRPKSYSKSMTQESFDNLKKSGHLDKTNMVQIVNICSQVIFLIRPAILLSIGNTQFAILPLTKAFPFSKFVASCCTPEAAKQTMFHYENITKGYISVAEKDGLEKRLASEILRTGIHFEPGINQITAQLAKFEEEGILSEFNIGKDNLQFFLFENLKKLPKANAWHTLANPFWQFCEVYNGFRSSEDDYLKGQKLFWGAKSYPQWQMAVLNKLMSVSRLSPYINNDVQGKIKRGVFCLLVIQPIEEVIAKGSTKNTLKRIGENQPKISNKRQRNL